MTIFSGSTAKAEDSALFAEPWVGVVTQNSATVNVAAADQPLQVFLRFRQMEAGSSGADWQLVEAREISLLRGENFILPDLLPDTGYVFEVRDAAFPDQQDDDAPLLGQGRFVTQRSQAADFSFALISDAHISILNEDSYRMGILRLVADTALEYSPELVLLLGDNIQTVGSGHAGYPLGQEHPYLFNLLHRMALGSLPANSATYTVLGNWEGENGWHPEINRAWARDARLNLLPSTDQDSYPESGSRYGDYYALTWGDALFVVLNAAGYTGIDHGLDFYAPGKPDDWTLGADQLAWLEQTLENSQARWKFLFSHHTIGGQAGDAANSRYGRGAGQAAQVGEQAAIHAMMLKYGVSAFFLGHDHVYADMTVDGIHYTVVGSAGAPWKFGTAETGYTDYRPESGFVLVTVKGDTAEVSFIRPDAAKSGGERLAGYTMSW